MYLNKTTSSDTRLYIVLLQSDEFRVSLTANVIVISPCNSRIA